MTRRRRRRRLTRRAQRTLWQIAILTVALSFIGLYNPVIRMGVNAVLIWLAVRALIIGIIALAVMWTYQYLRPPKVKRRKVTQPTYRRRVPRRLPVQKPKEVERPRSTHRRRTNGTDVDATRATRSSTLTKEQLVNTPMSGTNWFYSQAEEPTEDE